MRLHDCSRLTIGCGLEISRRMFEWLDRPWFLYVFSRPNLFVRPDPFAIFLSPHSSGYDTPFISRPLSCVCFGLRSFILLASFGSCSLLKT